jgi:site-specific recombinase XerD
MHGSSGVPAEGTSLDMLPQQASLFDLGASPAADKPARPPLVAIPSLTGDSPLGVCRLPYHEYLRLSDKSANTVACFLSDLSLLVGFLGADRALDSIRREDLERWRTHLKHDGHARGARPTPKTVARRMTFLKNFFGWLASEHIIPLDPSTELKFRRPSPPLGEVLFEREVQRLIEASRQDVRCEALVLLLLEAGLKREELLGLRLRDVDLSDPKQPAIEVHFPGQDKRWRERRMSLPPEWTNVYARYVERYRPAEHVFECTARNLNYVLVAAVRSAGLYHPDRPVTLRMLRDIYAVRQLRSGVSPDVLRERLGLSDEAWVEASEKYHKLAFPA